MAEFSLFVKAIKEPLSVALAGAESLLEPIELNPEIALVPPPSSSLNTAKCVLNLFINETIPVFAESKGAIESYADPTAGMSAVTDPLMGWVACQKVPDTGTAVARNCVSVRGPDTGTAVALN